MRRLWTIETVDGPVHDFDGIGLTEFGREPFQGYLDYREVAPGVGLYCLEGEPREDFVLAAAEHAPGDMLVMGCVLSGEGHVSAKGSEDQSWRQTGRLYALTPYGRRASYHISKGTPWRMMALKVDAQLLDRVANDHPPSFVRRAIQNGGAPMATSRPLTSALARVAEDIVRPVYRGRMAGLYREAKVLELLALQLDAFAEEPATERGLVPREIARVHQARDRLLSDLGTTPALHDLAYNVGLTPKRLNQGFRELFGTTAFELLRDARLEAARALLAECPNMPLKQIAWRVGYSQATNFISAYRRRFGVPPATHRRLSQLDD